MHRVRFTVYNARGSEVLTAWIDAPTRRAAVDQFSVLMRDQIEAVVDSFHGAYRAKQSVLSYK